jgi:hypothetical protein
MNVAAAHFTPVRAKPQFQKYRRNALSDVMGQERSSYPFNL